MTGFDGADPGTPEAVWRESGVREAAAPLDIGAIRRLVVLAAHPDDETLAAGALMHAVARQGREVAVVIATSGEASHPRSPTTTPAQLAGIREREVAAAVESLAPAASLTLLRLPDGDLAGHRAALQQGVRRAVRSGDTVVSTWRDDRHPDHEALAEVAAEVAVEAGASLLEAPIWLWHWGAPADLPAAAARFVPDADSAAAKRAALARHVSQVAPLSPAPGDEAVVPPAMLEHFGGDEVFVPSGAQPVDFDAMYEASDDPWGFEDRWYERRKRALTLAALPTERFRSTLEIGCSIGLTSEALADRADALVAVDVAPRAVALAAGRLADRPWAAVQLRRLPDEWPEEWGPDRFDLVVLSETGFYLGRDALIALADRVRASLAPDGTVLLCHWRPHVVGLELAGDAVHAVLRERLGLTRTVEHVESDFRLEVLQAPPARSVAEATGLR